MSGPFGSQHWMYNPSPSIYSRIIDQSLRFDAASESELSQTFASGGNRRKWTFSTWIKRTTLTPSGNDDYIFGIRTAANNASFMFLNWRAGDDLIVTGQSTLWLRSDRVFRDASAWYHIVWSLDTDNSTASQRMRLYVNGSELTSFSTDSRSSLSGDQAINAAAEHNIGRHPSSTGYGLGAYLAETHFIDGQAYDPSYFGETSNGIWVPKAYSGSYGTTGFFLTYQGTGTATTSQGTTAQANIGDDQSGLGNNFAVSALAATDVVPDSPTNNFCTLNPLAYSTLGTLSEGNLKIATSTNNRGIHGTMPIPTSGKWYWELHVDSFSSGGGVYVGFGSDASLGYDEYASTKGVFMSTYNQAVDVNGSTQSSPYNSQGNNSTSNGDIYSFALDVDNQKFYVAKNGTYRGSSDPSAGSGGLDVSAVFTNAVTDITVCLTRGGSYNETYSLNFGQDSKDVASANADENGIGTFEYAVPTGFLALCTSNLPEPAIGPNSGVNEQADDYFETVLYAGTGSTQSITGIFQPDFVWIKARDGAGSGRQHMLFDSIRGATKVLRSHLTNAEVTVSTSLTSFNSDGFTIGSDSDVNTNSENFVAWNWKAGGTAVSNTDGSVSSTVSADTDAGFSIVQYEGLASGTQTVGHGLNSAPEYIIFKNKDDTSSWVVYSKPVGTGGFLLLNSTGSKNTSDVTNTFNSTAPTASVFTVGTNNAVGGNGETIIAYCFHSVEGYCKVGSYSGNGNADGTFVYTGFRPAWVLWKRYDGGTNGWFLMDSKRDTENVANTFLRPNATDQEATAANSIADFLSNGFKLRGTGGDVNTNTATYLYLAFAEAPFKYANAR